MKFSSLGKQEGEGMTNTLDIREDSWGSGMTKALLNSKGQVQRILTALFFQVGLTSARTLTLNESSIGSVMHWQFRHTLKEKGN